MKAHLTPAAIRDAIERASATGQRSTLADADSRIGLSIRFTPKSPPVWSVSCQNAAGESRRFGIGHWPALSVAQARKAAETMRHKARYEGVDPIRERRTARAAAKAEVKGVSLKGLLDAYEADQSRANAPRRRSWDKRRQQIASVFRVVLSRPVAGISVVELQAIAEAWPSRASAASAVGGLRPALRWGSHPGRALCSKELIDLSVSANSVPRERTLSSDELARLLPVLRAEAAAGSPYAAVMRVLLLTGCRRDEIADATWGDYDPVGGVLTIPASRSKNGRQHTVSLSWQAREAIEQRRTEVQPADCRIFQARRTGRALADWHRETQRLQALSDTAGFTRHDLRRTAATIMGELGTEPYVIEAALNHQIHSKLASVYNKSRYTEAVAQALQRLADKLDAIEGTNVIALPLRAAG